ncbi:hypothetical protein LOTGIDRAFT_157519 [Lottia gigantea]|uniref:Uncharacterized protein n=1 Tax=Lottia gigantea TaxID=225164 RepID=V4CGY1_LOTGI|nr:hypothetical protein LOTGIDRAFT_157519 [Lottia gigantea]ESP01340.1 hypothetical protein LOTGIDRAFT_157519 [Lottia gigantea]
MAFYDLSRDTLICKFIQKSQKLKKRLQLKYPQLVFHLPAKRFKSELVFVEDVQHVEKIQSSSETNDSTGTDTETTDSSETPIHKQFDDNTLHSLYTAALKLKAELHLCKGYEGS